MQEENQVPGVHRDQRIVEDGKVENQVEKEIDLNLLFPDKEIDLNALFPESDIKSLLRKVFKNQNDIKKLTARFKNELADDSPSIHVSTQKESD